jgi:hypothetical protein
MRRVIIYLLAHFIANLGVSFNPLPNGAGRQTHRWI